MYLCAEILVTPWKLSVLIWLIWVFWTVKGTTPVSFHVLFSVYLNQLFTFQIGKMSLKNTVIEQLAMLG